MRIQTRLVLFGLFLTLVVQPTAAEPSTPLQFHIPVQPLGNALTAWSRQSRVQLIWETDPLGMASQLGPLVRGHFTADEALSRLLAGTGLTYGYVDAQTVAIR